LGKLLLSLGYVVAADLAGALAGRVKLDYLIIPDFPEDEIDPAALDLIGEERM
jgi:hypothetical protein